MNLPKSKLVKSQKITKSATIGDEKLTVTIRHDDNCGNNHNTFTITAELSEVRNNSYHCVCGGMIYKEIAKFFPSLEPYLKWHLCSTNGPMHYLANTLYHAGDKDCWGLRKGERRQIINGKTKKPSWKLVAISPDGEEFSLDTIPNITNSEEPPTCEYTLEWRPWYQVGEGKAPDIDNARKSAIWPDASLEQLQNKESLEVRLPGLMAEFKKAVESLGLTY